MKILRVIEWESSHLAQIYGTEVGCSVAMSDGKDYGKLQGSPLGDVLDTGYVTVVGYSDGRSYGEVYIKLEGSVL